MKGCTRCTRDCPADAHIHYVTRGWVGSWYTLERVPRGDSHLAWLEHVRAANRGQRWIPRLRRPRW
jgi:hypothetical protein